FLKAWEKARIQSSDMLQQIAKRRVQFFKEARDVTPRIFRFVLSYSVLFQGHDSIKVQHLKEKKDKFLEILKPLTYAVSWKPENLLEFVGGLVNFTMEHTGSKRPWNPHQSLASQLSTGGKMFVEEDKLGWKIDHHETEFKSYRAV